VYIRLWLQLSLTLACIQVLSKTLPNIHGIKYSQRRRQRSPREDFFSRIIRPNSVFGAREGSLSSGVRNALSGNCHPTPALSWRRGKHASRHTAAADTYMRARISTHTHNTQAHSYAKHAHTNTTTSMHIALSHRALPLTQSAPEYTLVASKPYDDAGDDATVQDTAAYLSRSQRNLIVGVAGI